MHLMKTSRSSVIICSVVIIYAALESNCVHSLDCVKPPAHIVAVDVYRKWVFKLYDALFDEPRFYSEIHADRIPTVGALEYPGCNATKQGRIQELWRIYYTCLEYQFKALGSIKVMLPDAVAVLKDGVLNLQCILCLSPRNVHLKAEWFMRKRFNGKSKKVIEDDFTIISNDNTLSVYKVSRNHAGIYWCQLGSSRSQESYVHVLSDDDPTIGVRPSSDKLGLDGTNDAPLQDTLKLVTHWTDWNQCTSCGKVGRRTKTGTCFVRSYLPLTIETANDATILSLFVYGLPCRSQILPKHIRDRPEVLNYPDKIMKGLCKVPCVDEMFEVRNEEGKLVSLLNNSAGEFSTLQMPPRLPPLIVRQIKWPIIGERLTVTCPGSANIDTPIDWRINMEKLLIGTIVNASTRGRVSIDLMDRIVFEEILQSDGHRYVCYQNSKVVGIVTLIPVRRSNPNTVEIDAILLFCFFGLILLTYFSRSYYYNRRLIRAVEKGF